MPKLKRITDASPEVWKALAEYVATGAPVTLLLGNHDIELSLPRVRKALLQQLGAGNVEFLCNNEAFTLGPLLVEHGNRYDKWNAVPYDNLRAVCSALSRGAEPPPFAAMPGSELVVRVMNGIKARHSFVDLLKPEDSAVLPLLAVLEGERTRKAIQFFRAQWRASRMEYDRDQQPVDPNYIAEPPPHPDEELFALAESLADGGYDPNQIGVVPEWASNFIDRWHKRYAAKKWDVEIDMLYRAFRTLGDKHHIVFDIASENADYLGGATASARNGFEVIVYGHTHLVKRQTIQGNGKSALYLNAGAWADLMRLPAAVYGDNEAVAKAQLKTFAEDMAANNMGPWRRVIPTFAQIDLDGDNVIGADVYFFYGPGRITSVTTPQLISRFA